MDRGRKKHQPEFRPGRTDNTSPGRVLSRHELTGGRNCPDSRMPERKADVQPKGKNMKDIVIISASPRKGGNSDILCDQFMKGALEAGHKVEKIALREKNIHPCLGCDACQNTHRCVQKDDMAAILDRLVEADVIVMATPVYFYTMSAQMKTLIDRTVPRYTEISGKEFYFIATAADGNEKALERTIDGFHGFTDCLENVTEKGVLLAPGVWKKGEVTATAAMDKALAMGRNI